MGKLQIMGKIDGLNYRTIYRHTDPLLSKVQEIRQRIQGENEEFRQNNKSAKPDVHSDTESFWKLTDDSWIPYAVTDGRRKSWDYYEW